MFGCVLVFIVVRINVWWVGGGDGVLWLVVRWLVWGFKVGWRLWECVYCGYLYEVGGVWGLMVVVVVDVCGFYDGEFVFWLLY